MAILMMLILPIHEHGICFHLCLPSFLSSVLCSFLRTGLLPPCLGLFLGTLFFLLLYQMGFFSWFLFLQIRCWCTGMPFISGYWLCIQLFCQIHLLGRVVFEWIYRVFHVHYHVVCKQWQFHSSFPIWMPFIAFSCLTAGASTSHWRWHVDSLYGNIGTQISSEQLGV